MLMVVFEIFDWKYFREIRQASAVDVAIMAITVAVVVPTHDLAIGVIVGVILHYAVRALRSDKSRSVQSEA